MPECEIVELHHDRKLDAPSGTAKRTAELIARGRRQRPRADPLGAPAGPGRPPGGDLRRRGPDALDPPRLDRPPLVHARRAARGARGRRAARAASRSASRTCSSDAELSRHGASDATAQAELVRSGEVEPGRAGRGRDRAGRGAQPASSTRSSTSSTTQAREAAAGELARRPVHGRARSCSRTSAPRFAGQPLHLGMQAAEGRRLPRAGRHLPRRSASATPGFVTIGKTNTPELGILPTTEPRGLRRRRATPGTSSTRPGGSSGGSAAAVAAGHGAGRARQRRRRLDPDPGQRTAAWSG